MPLALSVVEALSLLSLLSLLSPLSLFVALAFPDDSAAVVRVGWLLDCCSSEAEAEAEAEADSGMSC